MPHFNQVAVLKSARKARRQPAERTDQGGAAEPRARKRTPAGLKKLLERLEAVAREIDAVEGRRTALDRRFCAPDFYESTPPDERRRLELEHRELGQQIDALMQQWEALETERSALESA